MRAWLGFAAMVVVFVALGYGMFTTSSQPWWLVVAWCALVPMWLTWGEIARRSVQHPRSDTIARLMDEEADPVMRQFMEWTRDPGA